MVLISISDTRWKKAGNSHFATVALENKSLTLPPATLRNAEPQNPVTNRNTRKTAVSHSEDSHKERQAIYSPILGAKATGHENIKNRAYETR